MIHYRNVLIETHVLDDPTGPANLYILVSDKNNWLFYVIMTPSPEGEYVILCARVFVTNNKLHYVHNLVVIMF